MAVRNPIEAILCLCFLLIGVVAGATDPGDYEILEKFRKGITNSGALNWPKNSQDPCGPPSWDYIYCSRSRVTQIQTKNLGLKGTLPSDLNKLSMLVNVGLQGNNLSGPLPSFKGLSNLQYAFLGGNQFDAIPDDFFAGLGSLQSISLDRNPLNQSTGWTLPPDLAESAQLTNLSLIECNLAGPLPDFLGNMRSLVHLKLSYNRLAGEIQASYSGLPLQTLLLNNQNSPGLSGDLNAITSMTFLTTVGLHGNQFTGLIPSSIGALTSLTRLWLNNNKLVGLIPSNLTDLPQLQSLRLANNLFMGPIPTVSFPDFIYSFNSFCQSEPGVPCPPDVTALLDFLAGVDYPPNFVSSWSGNNSCTGSWLGIVCSGGKIAVINMPNYHLNGTISPSLGELDSLTQILLGGNNLRGKIPSSLTKLKSLTVLNLSLNNISPPVPKFASSVTLILDGNRLLDGDPSSPGGGSSSDSPGSSGGSSSSSISKTLGIVIPVVAVVIIVALDCWFLLYHIKRTRNSLSQQDTNAIQPGDADAGGGSLIAVANANNSGAAIEAGNLITSAQVLRVATRNFCSDNVLGEGGFGMVYKGVLSDGKSIAVRRSDSAVKRKVLQEFRAEIAVLSKVRHRNLVSILGYCEEDREMFLVYEYMPQGPLSKHLFHWKEMQLEPLSWKKRLIIALDVARGIDYLHNFANELFVHRDLKPSNILLGNDFRAKVSDFGLAKLSPEGSAFFATKLAGTFGYLAPEYAVTGKVTTKMDVYSFGIMLMELLTGFKVLDETRDAEPHFLTPWFLKMKSDRDKLKSIIDPAIALTEEIFDTVCIIAELAGHCAMRDPSQRPDMGYAVSLLAPLVEKWSPAGGEQDDNLETDTFLQLGELVQRWQVEGGDSGASSSGSIPAKPAGFAESFTSADGR